MLKRIPRTRLGWIDWLPAIVLPISVLLLAPSNWPPWAIMWWLAAAVFAGLKWLTWHRSDVAGAPWWQHAGYLVAWPGLDADTFLSRRSRALVNRPSLAEWLTAAAKLLFGVYLFWEIVPRLVDGHPLVAGWIGFAAVLLILHFGSFHLLSCVWRAIGIQAVPLMNAPFVAASVSEFWGRRWNTAFRDFTHKQLFRPLASRVGARWALLIGFFFSGLVHDLVISVPAQGGYGGPTLFFLIQAVAMLIERSPAGKRIGIAQGWQGWLFTAIILLGPVWLLFHPPFVTCVVVPFVLSVTSFSF